MSAHMGVKKIKLHERVNQYIGWVKLSAHTGVKRPNQEAIGFPKLEEKASKGGEVR